jgi:hypothetical protein
LRRWTGEAAPEAPPVILNKHCPCCPFRDGCRQLAEREDSLSLLDRITPKLMRKYHEKGISTVHQLSHLFRPRRNRKRGKRPVRSELWTITKLVEAVVGRVLGLDPQRNMAANSEDARRKIEANNRREGRRSA